MPDGDRQRAQLPGVEITVVGSTGQDGRVDSHRPCTGRDERLRCRSASGLDLGEQRVGDLGSFREGSLCQMPRHANGGDPGAVTDVGLTDDPSLRPQRSLASSLRWTYDGTRGAATLGREARSDPGLGPVGRLMART